MAKRKKSIWVISRKGVCYKNYKNADYKREQKSNDDK